jgi:hypothetical protein
LELDGFLNLPQLEVQAVEVGEFCSKKVWVHILIHMGWSAICDNNV